MDIIASTVPKHAYFQVLGETVKVFATAVSAFVIIDLDAKILLVRLPFKLAIFNINTILKIYLKFLMCIPKVLVMMALLI